MTSIYIYQKAGEEVSIIKQKEKENERNRVFISLSVCPLLPSITSSMDAVAGYTFKRDIEEPIPLYFFELSLTVRCPRLLCLIGKAQEVIIVPPLPHLFEFPINW